MRVLFHRPDVAHGTHRAPEGCLAERADQTGHSRRAKRALQPGTNDQTNPQFFQRRTEPNGKQTTSQTPAAPAAAPGSDLKLEGYGSEHPALDKAFRIIDEAKPPKARHRGKIVVCAASEIARARSA
jgi:hypothetical protein